MTSSCEAGWWVKARLKAGGLRTVLGEVGAQQAQVVHGVGRRGVGAQRVHAAPPHQRQRQRRRLLELQDAAAARCQLHMLLESYYHGTWQICVHLTTAQ